MLFRSRINSLLNKSSDAGYSLSSMNDPAVDAVAMLPVEKEIIKMICQFPAVVKQAGEEMSPAIIANYIYDLVKEYNQFYQEVPVLKESDRSTIFFRLMISSFTSSLIRKSMHLLGIDVPTRM